MRIVFYLKISHNKYLFVVREFLEFIFWIVKPINTFLVAKKLVTHSMISLKKALASKPQMRVPIWSINQIDVLIETFFSNIVNLNSNFAAVIA